MHLKYLRVRNAVAELESIVKKLERIGPGLYVAYYEQLRVDRVNYTNKLEGMYWLTKTLKLKLWNVDMER